MKKTTIIVLVALLLCGCASKKKLLEMTSSDKAQLEQKDVRSEVQQTQQTTTAQAWETAAKGEEDIEITHVKYDTSKPVNPDTGKPPVESETTAVKRSKASKETKGSENITVEATKIETHRDSTQLSYAEKIEITKDEKIKKSLPLYIYVIGVGILIFLIWAAWQWLKRFRR